MGKKTRGIPNDVKRAKPRFNEAGEKLCKHPNCQKPVEKGRRNWCGEACIDDWMVRNNPGHARKAVKERDQGVCSTCHRDTLKLQKRIQKVLDQRINGSRSMMSPAAVRMRGWLVRFGVRTTTNWDGLSVGSLWDADHIKAVVEGGGACGLDNLRTLCISCHKAETRALAKRRAEERRAAKKAAKEKKDD